MALWVSVIVVFFSVSRSKEDLYILPAYTGAAALIGSAAAIWLGEPQTRSRPLTVALTVAGLLIGGLGLVTLSSFSHMAESYRIRGVWTIATAAAAGGVLVAVFCISNRRVAAMATMAIALITANWIFAIRTLPAFETLRPVRALCEVIKSNAGEDALVGYYKFASPSMVFYLRRQIFEYYDRAEIERAFSSGREVYCIMTQEEYLAVKGSLPAEAGVLATHPLFRVKFRSIFERAEPARVLLISNNPGTSFNDSFK
jgi:4-amino-4-deoxy-L-arabinose transferase-like glycosyltransferase